jgi:lactoylglutathione lyase
MKRFHVHVAVPDLQQSIRFYSTLFGAEPSVVKEDYAKWMLEDPRVNFAISQRGSAEGVNHLGFQVDDAAELEQIHAQLEQAESAVTEEKGVACCGPSARVAAKGCC